MPFNCPSGLLINPDFELGSTGWSFSANASITTDAYFGTQAAYAGNGVGGVSQNYPALPGEVFSMEVYAKKDAPEDATFSIKFYDSSWNEVGTATYIQITSSTFERYTTAGVAPAGTAWVHALGWKSSGTGNATFDGFCFEKWNVTAPICLGNNCDLKPSYDNYIWAMDDSGIDDDWREYDDADLILCDNGNGTLSIKGNVINGRDAPWGNATAPPCGPQDGWYIDLTLSDMQSWTEFQGSYVVDASCPNAYLDLDYWDVNGTFTGIGCNTGRIVTVAPSAGYRLQVGTGGNSHTCNFGMSTWFGCDEGGNPFKSDIYAHIDSVCYLSMRPSSCENELLNVEFDSGTSDWSLNLYSGNTGTYSIDNSSQLSGTNSAFVDITSISGTNWHTQLSQPNQSISAGKTYIVSFEAKSTANRDIAVSLQRSNAPYTTYWWEDLSITTTGTTYSYEFTMDSTNVGLVGLLFHLGETLDDVWIDNVSFKEACGEICDNGIDDDGDSLIDCLDPDCDADGNCTAACLGNNLGFESDFANWTAINGVTISTDAAVGSKSAYMNANDEKVRQNITVEADSLYQISFWAKGTVGGSDWAGGTLRFYDAGNTYLGQLDMKTWGYSNWNQFFKVFMTPENTSYIQLEFAVFGSSSDMYFDDVCLQKSSYSLPEPTCSGCEIYSTPEGQSGFWFKDASGGWVVHDLHEGAVICDNGDGTKTIQATVTNGKFETSYPCGQTDGWFVEVNLDSKLTWAEWGGAYDDFGSTNNGCTDYHTDWEYWNVAGGTLTGFGCNAGTTHNVIGNVSGYKFQIGTGANRSSCNFGLAGWIEYDNNGTTQSFDIYFEMDESCYNLPSNCPNAITNEEFDNGTSDWSLYLQSGNTATFTIDNTNELSGTNSAFIDISAASGTTWHVQLAQTNHSIEVGKDYTISFDVKAAANRDIGVSLQRNGPPYTTYWWETVSLTTTGTTYSYDFTADSTNAGLVVFLFHLGENATDVWIDNVSYSETCSTTEDCNNCIDDDGDGLIDCADDDCGCSIPELEFCTYNLKLDYNETFNIRDFVHVVDGSMAVDWSQVYFTYTAVGANDPVVPSDWHLSDFNAGLDVTITSADDDPGTGNSGDGRYRIYLVRNGETNSDDHMTIWVEDGGSNSSESKCAIEICGNGCDDDGDGLIDSADPDCISGSTCALTNPYPGFPIDFLNNNTGWIDYDLGSDLEIVDNGNGTKTITGSIDNGTPVDFGSGINGSSCGATDGWTVNLALSDKMDWTTFQTAGGSANVHANCTGQISSLDYWDVSGTLTGTGCNAGRTLTITGPKSPYRLQIGYGGNNGDGSCVFGMSTWFDVTEGVQAINADIYAFLSESCYNSIPEICGNNVDDDGDGYIDNEDSDCPICVDENIMAGWYFNGSNYTGAMGSGGSGISPDNSSSCGTASNMNRETGANSTTYGNTGNGICIGAFGVNNTWVDDDARAIEFTLTFPVGKSGRLSKLDFYQQSPTTNWWIPENEWVCNNPANKFGVRVLKDGVEIYKNIDLATASSWQAESFDFSNLSEFYYTDGAVFKFELLAYEKNDLDCWNTTISAEPVMWDLDDVVVYGCCADVEICGNNIDDDGDGLIDSVDPDCPINETCSCSGTNLFDNPSFENGTFNGSTTFITGVQSDDLGYNWGTPVGLDGWSHGPLHWVDSPNSSDGSKMIYINNTTGGAVCTGQYYDIGTGIGQMSECAAYQLCFDWASFNRENPNGRATTSQPALDFTWFDISGNVISASHQALGTPVANQDFDNLIWSQVSYSFSLSGGFAPPANATQVRINLSEHTGQDNGLLFDAANLCETSPCNSFDPNVCYLISDGQGDGSSTMDTLYTFDHTTGAVTAVGPTGTTNIETMAMDVANGIIYTASRDSFGMLNPATGAFFPISTNMGSLNGADGSKNINGLDGMTYDATNNIIWATERASGGDGLPDDLLLQIDPTIGLVIQDAFGVGVGYHVVATNEHDLDDIALADNGTLYAISNYGSSGNQRLGTINKTTGVFTEIGDYGVEDVEGLTFSGAGQLLATTGEDGDHSNRLYSIDGSTATASFIGSILPAHDVEACECMSGNFINLQLGDKVWADLNGDGIQGIGEPGVENVTVNLLDGTGNPVLNGSSNPRTTITDSFGEYNFNRLSSGSYIIEFVLPLGTTFTTQNVGDDYNDSDANASTGRSHVITLTGTANDYTIDAGLQNVNPTIRDCDDDGQLFVADGNGHILRYDQVTGTLIDTFIIGLTGPMEMAVGPDGWLYVSDELTHEIRRYSLITGALIDVFASGLDKPNGMVFGPDGNLYVNDRGGDKVTKIDMATGMVSDFVLGITGLDSNNGGIEFGSDGNLYVASKNTDKVLRFNGATGVFIDTFVITNPTQINAPEDLVFGPDGHLYVTGKYNDKVARYNGTTGAYMGGFVTYQSGGIQDPTNLVFGEDGHLYVSSQSNNVGVLKYDGTTGAFIGNFASALMPNGLLFAPVQGCENEICGNGIDDDGDGQIDNADDDCSCVATSGCTGIEQDTVFSHSAKEVKSLSYFHTTATDANLLIVSATVNNNKSIVSAQYNGIELSLAKSGSYDGRTLYVYYLTNPTSGAYDVSIYTGNGGDCDITVGSVSYKCAEVENVFAGGLLEEHGQLAGVATIGDNISCATGDYLLDFLATDDDNITHGADQVQIVDEDNPSNQEFLSTSYIPSGATDIGWTLTNSEYVYMYGCLQSCDLTEICDDGIDNDGDGLIDCNDPDCQSMIFISNVTVSNCIDHAYSDVATVDVTVDWNNVAFEDTLRVTIDRMTHYIPVAQGATGSATVQFVVPADGSSNNIVLLTSFLGQVCDMSFFNSPTSCSADNLTCKTLYICGDFKSGDDDAWDHGFFEYLDNNNGITQLDAALAVNSGPGLGLYDVTNTSTLLNLTLADYDLIILSPSVNNDLTTDLLDSLREAIANVLVFNNYDLLELGMASSKDVDYDENVHNGSGLLDIYNYPTLNPLFDPINGMGDYYPAADVYLWRNEAAFTSGNDGVMFYYEASDVLINPSDNQAFAHGSRTFFGMYVDGVYATAANGGVTPVPDSLLFDPERHLTLQGKYYLDLAVSLAASACGSNPEICGNGLDDDGDGDTDCVDGDCGPPVIPNVAKASPNNCPFLTNGQITITATGSNLEYSIDNGATYQSTNVFNNLTAGSYTVRVRNSITDCFVNYTGNPVIITDPVCFEICNDGIDNDGDGLIDCFDPDCVPVASAGSDINICIGTYTDISATGSSGNGVYIYSWDNGLGAGQTHTVSPLLGTTDYIVTVEDGHGCTDVDTVSVTVTPCPEVCADGIDNDFDGLFDCDDPDCLAYGQPQPADDAYALCPGVVLIEQVSINDGNLQNPLFGIDQYPNKGAISMNHQGVFTYTPFNSVCGTDQFVYEICNQTTGCCNTAMVTLTLGDLDPPILVNVPDDLTIGCNEVVPVPAAVYGEDLCPGIFVSYDESSTQSGAVGCSSYTITRVWQSTDLCGNFTRDTQFIYVEDKTSPEIFRKYTLANGKTVVGGVSTNTTDEWKYVEFPGSFVEKPVVFTQLVTQAEGSAVAARIRNVSIQGFELALQEEEIADDEHVYENVSWMAIEPGVLSDASNLQVGALASVTQTHSLLGYNPPFSGIPVTIATMQTANDLETASMRFDNESNSSMEIWVQEDQSMDVEIVHEGEEVGYLSIAPGTIADENGEIFGETGAIQLNHNWKTVSLSKTYTKPVVIFGGASNNDGTALTIAVRNVTENSFEVQIDEWDNEDGNHANETVGFMVMEGSIPAESEYYCSDNSIELQIGSNLFAVDNCDNQIVFDFQETETVGTFGLEVERTWSAEDDCGNRTEANRIDTCNIVAFRLKAKIYGAYYGTTDHLMRDDLRQQGRLPIKEPYTDLQGFVHYGEGGDESISIDMLDETGNDAIVDWVVLEVRSPLEPNIVFHSKSALLQRDGDIVGIDGDTVCYFPQLLEGDYYLSIKHRNHLGIMTGEFHDLNVIDFPLIDFTNTSTGINGDETAALETAGGNRYLWLGDINGDKKVIYQGPSNDIFYMFSHVLSQTGNVDLLANYISPGYWSEDVNLDGMAIYQGPDNDRALLLYHSILSHPSNISLLANFIITEGLP